MTKLLADIFQINSAWGSHPTTQSEKSDYLWITEEKV